MWDTCMGIKVEIMWASRITKVRVSVRVSSSN